jgi:predicted HTH domain antitoxin
MTITLPLPAALERTLQPDRARLHLAIGAFVTEEATLGQAAEMAGISQTALMAELSRRRIPLHYGSEDFAEDIQAIASLTTKLKHGHHH